MDGCKEICQRQTEMEKARRPMFQQELEELRSKVRLGGIQASKSLNAIKAKESALNARKPRGWARASVFKASHIQGSTTSC